MVCPFKGLAPFDVDDAPFFFGRERLVGEMLARLAGAPLLGVVGPSGSGKSSAMRAGLLPELAGGVLPGSESWAQTLLRPGEHPLRALDDALGDGDGHRLVAVDQFEEVFTLCRDEGERARSSMRCWPPTGRDRRARGARRLLRTLRRAPGARPDAGRQPRARRPDAARRAAAGDRALGAARAGCAWSRSWSTGCSPTSRRSPARSRCCRRRCSSCGSAATAAACGWPPTSARAACAARSRASRRGRTRGCGHGEREVARAILLRLAGEQPDGGAVRRPVALERARRRPRGRPARARRARRRPARHALGGSRRGRARGAAARVAAPARLDRGGRRGPAPAPPPRRRGARVGGRRARSRRALSRRSPGRGGWTGAHAHRRELNAAERAFLDESRAEADREARRARRREPAAARSCSAASAPCSGSRCSPARCSSSSAARPATRRAARRPSASAPRRWWRRSSTARCCSPARAMAIESSAQTRGQPARRAAAQPRRGRCHLERGRPAAAHGAAPRRPHGRRRRQPRARAAARRVGRRTRRASCGGSTLAENNNWRGDPVAAGDRSRVQPGRLPARGQPDGQARAARHAQLAADRDADACRRAGSCTSASHPTAACCTRPTRGCSTARTAHHAPLRGARRTTLGSAERFAPGVRTPRCARLRRRRPPVRHPRGRRAGAARRAHAARAAPRSRGRRVPGPQPGGDIDLGVPGLDRARTRRRDARRGRRGRRGAHRRPAHAAPPRRRPGATTAR